MNPVYFFFSLTSISILSSHLRLHLPRGFFLYILSSHPSYFNSIRGRITLSRISIVRGCRAWQCSLLCLANSIPCCRARQDEHWRANLARLDPNRSGSLSRGKGISVCCALSVETVLCLRDSVHQQPHAAAARNRYRS
jgi:hypothetical protein